MAEQSVKHTRKQNDSVNVENIEDVLEQTEDSFRNEVLLWIVLAFSLILFISNFGIAGKAGDMISNVFFGFFGLMAYLFPIIFFAGIAFLISNQGNQLANVKIASAAIFMVFLCFFLELVGGDTKNFSPLNSYLWAIKYRIGGGLVGGLFRWLIVPNLGAFSAYIIDFAVMIVCIIVFTQRSLWKPIQHGGIHVFETARNESIRKKNQRRELREQKNQQETIRQQEQNKQRRIDHKAVGVSLDTAIKETSQTEGTLDFPIFMANEPAARQKQPDKKARAELGLKNQVPLSPLLKRPEELEQEKKVAMREIKPEMPKKDESVPNMEKPKPEPIPKKDADIKKPVDGFWKKTNDINDIFAGLLSDSPIQWPEEDSSAFEDIEVVSHTKIEGIAGQERVSTPSIEDLSEESKSSMEFTEPENDFEDIGLELEEVDANGFDAVIEEEYEAEEPVYEIADPAYEPEEPEEYETEEPIAYEPKPAERPMVSRTQHRLEPVKERQSKEEIVSTVQEVGQQVAAANVKREHIFPPLSLLEQGNPDKAGDTREHLQETALKLQQTLKNFGVNVTILNVSCGPSVTRYEIQPEMGVKVSKIVNLADDIKLNLAAADIRIEAPIPGKAAIGIEVPNKENVTVMFRDLIESPEFQGHKSSCAFAVGKDIGGRVIVTDICKMPHLLIAGATGSGKSVCINTIIMSILYKADPEDVKLILVDPKVVELSVYNGIPHLLLPVVTDAKKAAGALHWAVSEMMDRYQKFANYGVRDIKGYNAKIKQIDQIEDENKPQKMPYIVIIVDELADLMMVAPSDVEDAICRLAQLARAAGIHLIIATQRPSVNVITGLIKANMPSRIAFAVTSGIDSRTILDLNGAEKLLGKGDMLFHPYGTQKPVRVQGAFVSDSEVSDVVKFLTERNGVTQYDNAIQEQMASAGGTGFGGSDSNSDSRDAYFEQAANLLIEKDKASVSMLQRYFKIGFNRAARLMDQLEEAGIVGPEEGTKPRKILMGPEEFEEYKEEYI